MMTLKTKGYGELLYFQYDVTVLTEGRIGFSQLLPSYYSRILPSLIPLEELGDKVDPFGILKKEAGKEVDPCDIYRIVSGSLDKSCETPLFVTTRKPSPGDLITLTTPLNGVVCCYMLVRPDTFRDGINRHYNLSKPTEDGFCTLSLGRVKGFQRKQAT
jgi:hypothetical protein